jgi:hypothetical protein
MPSPRLIGGDAFTFALISTECAVIAHRRGLWWAVCAHSADESYPTLSEGPGLMFWFARKRLSGS